MKPNYYILAICLIVCPYSLYAQSAVLGGTVVLIYCDSSQVIVAADSRQVINDSIPSPINACKIHVFGKTIFVNTGTDTVFTPSFHYSMTRIASECYSPDSTLDNIDWRFLYRAGAAYDSFLNTIRIADSITFAKQLPHLAFETMWLGIRHGQIQYLTRNWRPEFIRKDGRVQGNTSFGSMTTCANSPEPVFRALGINGINKNCINGKTARWFIKKFGAVEGMTRLIQNDIALDTLSVGEPIDVLVYDSTGVHWQMKKNECKECEVCVK